MACRDLGLVKALPGRVVKQDRVLVLCPDGGEFYVAWTLNTEEHATRLPAPEQDPLRHGCGSLVEIVMHANEVLDELPDVIEFLDSSRVRNHKENCSGAGS